jgi:hypothetical protein
VGQAGRNGSRQSELEQGATAQTAPLEYVELGASEVGLATQRASLEVVTAGGDRLRIEVVGALDVPGVVRAFAERRS